MPGTFLPSFSRFNEFVEADLQSSFSSFSIGVVAVVISALADVVIGIGLDCT